MPPNIEICRYFQRGSCRYGARCKYLHPGSSKISPSNPFGFGTQRGVPIQDSNPQQPTPNPFGFGQQNNGHSSGGDGFGSKANQPKFENKWSRFNSSASASRQADYQPPAVSHKCTDPESCKRMILDDLANEKPLWKLTCYGHNRNGPCDIVGDTSYDELRALAYNDAKLGKSLESIVERERNMLNSKLIEFQNLSQKPYMVSSAPTPSAQNLFAGGSLNAPVVNNGFPPQVSSFSQLSGSLNTRSAAVVPNLGFGQTSMLQNNNQPSTFFQTNNSPSSVSGTFASQPQKSIQNFSPFGTTNSINGDIGAQRNPFSTLPSSSQTGNGANTQLNLFTPSAASVTFGQTTISPQLTNNMSKENNVDYSIWTKAEWKWNVGEIPEEAPPDIHIH